MSTDITFCANHEQCAVSYICGRKFTDITAWALVGKPITFSFADFEPEKGKDCFGFWKKAKLSLKPLEDK